MRDGARLAVTYFFPAPRTPGERLPVVLSMTPCRKDDDSYPYSYAVYPYFAKRGIAIAHVDARGAGASGGPTPDREHSDAELDDLVQVVAQLAAKPWSAGKIGMMGISWSGFSSLMTAMRRPPALKAIPTAHATDDLDGNDAHYIDGCLHLDVFAADHTLAGPLGGAAAAPAGAPAPATHVLPYVAGSGIAVGNWWGEATGDMRPADKHALVYDSGTLGEQVLVLGSPEVQLRTAVDAPAADWFARLEDVWPNGRVSLVTGGGINGT